MLLLQAKAKERGISLSRYLNVCVKEAEAVQNLDRLYQSREITRQVVSKLFGLQIFLSQTPHSEKPSQLLSDVFVLMKQIQDQLGDDWQNNSQQ